MKLKLIYALITIFCMLPTMLWAGVVTTTLQVSATTISTESIVSMAYDDDVFYVQMPSGMPYAVESADEYWEVEYSAHGFSLQLHDDKDKSSPVGTISIVY